MALEGSADCLLGNHDLFVLAAYHGAKSLKRGDTAQSLLTHPKAAVYMDWLATRALARIGCSTRRIGRPSTSAWICAHTAD